MEVATEKKDKGFTLVELLIVIVILGILATVTVFAVRGITDKGQSTACKADRNTLETAVEAYYAKNGTNPTETQLIGEFIKSASPNFDVNASGGVIMAPNTTSPAYTNPCPAGS